MTSPKLLSQVATAKSLQLCPTLCDPIDGSPPGSPIPGILQARTLEWVAISFSNAWKWKVKGKSLSRVRLLATPWTAAYQAPPSMGFSRQEYWSGVPLPSPSQVLLPKIKLPWQVIDTTVHSGSRPHAPFRKYCDPQTESCLIHVICIYSHNMHLSFAFQTEKNRKYIQSIIWSIPWHSLNLFSLLLCVLMLQPLPPPAYNLLLC